MAVLAVDTVANVPCDDCPRFRVIATEAAETQGAGPAVRVTIMGGCEGCEGSTILLRA